MSVRSFSAKSLALLAAAALLATLLAPVTAHAGPSAQAVGSIQGTVRGDDTGLPLTWSNEDGGTPVNVEVWRDAGGYWEEMLPAEWADSWGQTQPDGTYVLDSLDPGTYYLRFVDFWSTGYRTEFYNNAFDIADATPVVVPSGGTVTANISLGLIEWGGAAGTITDATSGALVDEVYVDAYEWNSLYDSWDWVWGASSLSLGDWYAEAPAGDYKLQFIDYEGRYLSQFYGGATDFDSADWVTVAPTHTTPNVNVAMVRAGHITGTITGPGGAGDPLKGVYAQVYEMVGGQAYEVAEGAHQLPTDAAGRYDYKGLPAGTYKIAFRDASGSYITEVYNNIPAPGDYDLDQWSALVGTGANVVVAAGATVPNVNAQLAAAGRLAGTVIESGTGDPVPWATVEAYTTSDVYVATAWADENGAYTLGNLAGGNYKVKFYSPDYAHEGEDFWRYNENWYSNQTSQATAGWRNVTAGATSWNTNATLVPTANWGTANGIVFDDETGSRLPGMGVGLSIWYDDGMGGYWVENDYTWTDTTGVYEFKYVPVGTSNYKITVYGEVENTFGVPYDPRELGPYSMAAGATQSHNAYLFAPTTDINGGDVGAISLFCTNGMTGLGGVPTAIYQYDDFSGEYWYNGGPATNAQGYALTWVPVGQYVVQAGPAVVSGVGYISEYYALSGDAYDPADAYVIDVTAGIVNGTYSLALGQGNKITGTVTDAETNQPIQGAYVSALVYNATWDVWEPVSWDGCTNAWTAADGSYTLWGLPAGDYKVHFSGWENDLGQQWWRDVANANSVDQAGVIPIAGTGMTISGKDAELSSACSIRGSAVDQDGNRATGIHVKLWWDDPQDGWAVIQSTYAYHDGDFGFGQFSAGTYKLEFLDDENYLYGHNWYHNVDTEGAATQLVMAAGDKEIVQQTVTATDTFYSPVFGTNRILTAINASQLAFADDSVTTVVIATGFNWPDALGGAALAGAYDGPILLTNPTYLPWEVMDEVERLGATEAIILGGTSAVSGAVESTLKSNLGQYHVRRLAGLNRYETAVMVANETVARLGGAYDGTAFVATGDNFPDALGASPLAAAACWPIYLTDPDLLTPMSRAAMLADGVDTAIILGGTGAVAPAVETSLNTMLGAANVDRIGGSTRYETAVLVAQYGVDHVYGLGWNNVAIATGQNYPDALAGGVLQGKTGSVLLLTPSNSLDGFVAAKLTAKKGTIVEARYIGGMNAVTDAVRAQVQAILY